MTENIKIMLKSIKAEILRDIRETFSYKTGIISDIAVLSILFLSIIYLGSGTQIQKYYKGLNGSRTLLLTGYIFWTYSVSAINTMSKEINYEAMKGTLAKKYTAVTPFYALLAGVVLSSLTINSIVAIFIIAISKIVVGINIIINIKVFSSLIITLVGMYGVGLLYGGIALRVKRIGQLVFVTQIILLFISDTLTKTKLSEGIGKIIPLTAGIDIARKSIGGLNVGINDWSILIGSSIFWLFIGMYFFHKSQQYAKKYGLINVY